VGNSRLLGFLCTGLVILALGPIVVTHAVRAATPISQTPLPDIAGCRSLHGWVADWTPVFVTPDYSIANSYQCDGYRLHVKLVQYVEQHQGKEAVGEFNRVIPRSWWNYTITTRRSIDDSLDIDEFRVELPSSRLTIWNWYAVGDRSVSTGLGAKALEAVNALRLRASATSNLTVAVEADPEFAPGNALKSDASAIWNWFIDEMRRSG
jgi:EpsI family protein